MDWSFIRITGGITNNTENAKRLMAEGASFEDARFWVFRRMGLVCYRCGETVIQNNAGGQSCFCCPGSEINPNLFCEPLNASKTSFPQQFVKRCELAYSLYQKLLIY